MAFMKRLLQITSRSANLRLRLLVSQHHAVIAAVSLPSKGSKKKKQGGEQLLCKHCEKSKQYYGICKKIWHYTDGVNWVCCDECQIWVHIECDLTCNNLEDLENTDYFCTDCKSKYKPV
ncbi:hypothetical protein SETIT_1G274300v2, partial [Setaria italica]